MADKKPKTFRGIPINYRSRAQIDNDQWDEYCRAAFPDTPQDQIAQPRYYGRWFPLPTKPLSDTPEDTSFIRHWLYSVCRQLAGFDKTGKATLRRNYQTRFARAARWWASLRTRSLLALHQSLYPRREKWKD